MRTAKDFRALARKALTGRYWWALLAGLIAGILGGSSVYNGASSGTAAGSSSTAAATTGSIPSPGMDQAFSQMDAGVAGIAAAVAAFMLFFILTVGVVMLIIGAAVEVGYNKYNIALFESDEPPSLKVLFSSFSMFGRALWLRVLIGLKVVLWSLLFVVPGIIAAYRYAMAPYILADNPELTASQCIEKSKEMMATNKWRLFCLQFSFIGWMLLCGLTFGLGTIFLAPYMKAADTAFYMERAGKLPVEGQAA